LNRSPRVGDGTLDVIVDELYFSDAIGSGKLRGALVAAPRVGLLIERILRQNDSFLATGATQSAKVRAQFRPVFAAVALAQEHVLVFDFLTPARVFQRSDLAHTLLTFG
jgi:hypothetical protein